MSIESLSALLDGELRPHELERTLAALERDPALRAQFDRLVAARAALQGTRVAAGTAGMADRVRAALQAEPVRVAPPARRVPRLLWIPLAAAAAATGFAVLAVRPQPETAPAGTAAAEVLPAAPGVVPVSMPVEAAPVAPAVDPKAKAGPGSEQLQGYLMIYSQARADAGAGGSLGFARVASQPAPAADAPASR